MRESDRKYKEGHRKELADKQKIYRDNHPIDNHIHYEKYREGYIRRAIENHNKIKNEIIELLGGKCVNPYNLNHGDFEFDLRCLHIDHIEGKGNKERKKLKSPFKYYVYVLEKIKLGSKDYQLLCANCNWIKRIINKEHRGNKK